VPTSGMLYLPSWALDGSSLSPLPLTAAPRMSLCFMPAGAQTTMQRALLDLVNYSERFGTTPATREESPTPATGVMAEDDAPF
jgi:hypothetical protein